MHDDNNINDNPVITLAWLFLQNNQPCLWLRNSKKKIDYIAFCCKKIHEMSQNLLFGTESKLLKTFLRAPAPTLFCVAKSSSCVISLEDCNVEWNYSVPRGLWCRVDWITYLESGLNNSVQNIHTCTILNMLAFDEMNN